MYFCILLCLYTSILQHYWATPNKRPHRDRQIMKWANNFIVRPVMPSSDADIVVTRPHMHYIQIYTHGYNTKWIAKCHPYMRHKSDSDFWQPPSMHQHASVASAIARFQHRSPSLLAILSSLASMSSLLVMLVCITRERAYSQIASRRVYRPIYWIKPTRLTSGRQLLSRTTIVSQHCIRNTNITTYSCICVVHVQCNS